MGCGAHLHHNVLESLEVNTRGKAPLGYTATSSLYILNVEQKPIFITSMKVKVMDITVVSAIKNRLNRILYVLKIFLVIKRAFDNTFFEFMIALAIYTRRI